MQPQSQDRRANSWFDLSRILDVIYKILRTNVSFGSVGFPDNMAGVMLSGNTGVAANTQFTVTHNLGVIPVGFIILRRDQHCSIYDTGTAWTTTQIFVAADAPNVNYTIFVLK